MNWDYEIEESIDVRQKLFAMRKLAKEIFEITSGCHHSEISDIGTKLFEFDEEFLKMEVSLVYFEEDQRKNIRKDMKKEHGK